ncbi:MAG: OmpA family protein, partial [Methylococcaceae bacterium]|nr:OmpA family protein [Methylococcaceae bacterium]
DDKCPGSLSGVQVSKYGCWIVDVKFDNDKDFIKPQYYPNLDSVAEAIKKHPEVMVEVQGHTSKTGGYEHNMDLSERRAKAVKDYLVGSHHLPNVTSRGYGWDRPIDTNDTEEGRANNRRVQLEVDGKPQSDQ